jgi:electron transfer flavoprotein alpha subunit
MADVLVFVPSADGVADKVALQALALGRQLAAGDDVHALVIGDERVAGGLGAFGATRVHLAQHPSLDAPAPDAAARILDELATSLGVAFVIGPGTEEGNTIVARAAARAGLPFAANCTAVTNGSPVTVVRSRWGGSLLEEAAIHADRAVLTVAAHVIEVVETGGAAPVAAFTPQLDAADLAVRVVGRVPAPSGGVSLADAKVVVSGGRGAGSAEGFAPVMELASLLGAAVGCSRAVTIAGWRPHTEQVGQTGTKIAPELYIAAGISGATQHLAGAKGAKRILAINKDGDAPIMAAADYAVIGDMAVVLPAISSEVRRRRGA